MADVQNIVQRIVWAMDEWSDGAGVITPAEVEGIKEDEIGLPAGFIDRVAEMANGHDVDGVIFSEEEVEALKKEYPMIAGEFFDEARRSCRWPITSKLFGGDIAAGFFPPACTDVLRDDIRYLKEELGFAEGELEIQRAIENVSRYEFQDIHNVRRIVRSPEFAAFVKRLTLLCPPGKFKTLNVRTVLNRFLDEKRRAYLEDERFTSFAHLLMTVYGMDAVENIDDAIWIYTSPKRVELLLRKDIQAAYKQLDGIFGFGDTPFFFKLNIFLSGAGGDPLILEHFVGGADVEGLITGLQETYVALKKVYGNACEVKDVETLSNLMKIQDEPNGIKELLDPAVLEAFDILSGKYGIQFNILKGIGRYQFLEAAKNEGLMALLKGVYGTLLVGRDAEGEDVCHLEGLEELNGLARLVGRPDAREFLSLLPRFISGGDISNLGRMNRGIPGAKETRAMLDGLKERFPRIYVSLLDIECFGLDKIQAIIASEGARKAYESLCKLVPRSDIAFDNFIPIVEIPGAPGFLADEDFQKKVREVRSILGPYLDSWNSINSLLKAGPMKLGQVLSAEGRLAIAELKELGFAPTVNDIDNILYFTDGKGLSILKTLKKEGLFGEGKLLEVEPDDLWSITPESLKKAGEILDDPKILDGLRSFAGAVKNFVFYDLPGLIETLKTPDAVRAFENIRKVAGGPIDLFWERGSRLWRLYQFLEGEKLRILLEPSFVEFCGYMKENFLGDHILSVEDIELLIEAYPEAGVIRTENFRNIATMLKDDFHVNRFEADMIQPISKLAAAVDLDDIKDMKGELGKKISSNDISLLTTVSRTPGLKELLFDRKKLIAEAGKIYDEKSLERTERNFDSKKVYTERPSLGDMDSISLLRLVLLKRALEDPGVLGKLGEIISRDMQDTTTEYGGEVLWNGTGLYFNNVDSTARFDGAYNNALTRLLEGGFMSFHLHALVPDESKFAGPSGDPWAALGGDWGCARVYRATDVVITTAGFANDKTEELLINVDMYYVDASGNPFVIDLGLHRVPVKQPIEIKDIRRK